MSYSTVGPNTSQNIAGELLKSRTGLAAVYVPFAGGALAEAMRLQEVMSPWCRQTGTKSLQTYSHEN